MTWLQSHHTLERNPKTLILMAEMGWDLDTAIAKLHRFWWWVLDYALDGSLEKHQPETLAGAIGLPAERGDEFLAAMIKARFIDQTPYLRLHNWWKYAGPFLRGKYGRTEEKWQVIADKYEELGGIGKEQAEKTTDQSVKQPRKAPDLGLQSEFEAIWGRYPKKHGKGAAERHFRATVKTGSDILAINTALDNYLASDKVKSGFPYDGSTWFNAWREWVDRKPDLSTEANKTIDDIFSWYFDNFMSEILENKAALDKFKRDNYSSVKEIYISALGDKDTIKTAILSYRKHCVKIKIEFSFRGLSRNMADILVAIKKQEVK